MAKSGSKNPGRSKLSLLRSGKGSDEGLVADWGTINPKILVDLVQVVAGMSGAVRFGYTRDGGAYSVGIYLDDDRETFYFRPSDDISEAVERLTDLLRDG